MRGWLKKLVDQYLPAVEGLSHSLEDRATAQEWASWMRQQWEAHGLKALKQQRNLMTEVRGAIKQRLGEGHVALETMDFSREEWIEINRPIVQMAALQNENQVILDPGTVNAIVTRATNLLMSREWSEIAAGLVVVTGRRSTEVLKTAVFEAKSEFSLMFTGALKRKGEERVLRFEIPTLCQAEYVITAWNKLRKILLTSELTNTQVNQRFADEVAKACDRHFADLVSPVEGRENLYSHLFRKVYATIATYFYCPTDVDEAEFRAEIQGHFSGYEGLSLAERRTIASDRHYRSYVIADQDGNMRKGVRLGWQGVEPIEAFRKGEAAIEKIKGEGMSEQEFELGGDEDRGMQVASSTVRAGRKRRRSSLGTYADEHDRWIQVLMAVCPDCPNQVEKTSALLSWIEERLQDGEGGSESIAPSGVSEQAKGQSPSAGADIAIVADQARTLAWLTGEIERLRGRVGELERERDELKGRVGEVTQNQPEVEQLRADNACLRQERDQAVSKLETFRTLLNGNGGTTAPTIAPNPASARRAVSQMTVEASAKQLATAPKAVALQPKEVIESEAEAVDDAELDPGVVRALRSLMDFNDSQENHAQKWAISFPVMKDLCKQVGVATQSKIDQVFKAKAHQIEKHHQQHGLGQRHNRVHKDESISQFIQL